MKAVDTLKSVLCGPDGKCCIAGSQADRDTVDTALAAIQHYLDHIVDANKMVAQPVGEREQ